MPTKDRTAAEVAEELLPANDIRNSCQILMRSVKANGIIDYGVRDALRDRARYLFRNQQNLTTQNRFLLAGLRTLLDSV